MKTYKEQVIILTGASSGIGLAFAKAIAPEGPKIMMVGRDQDKLEATASAVAALGAETITLAGDVSGNGFCQEIVDATVSKWGRVDTLINNAGITLWADFEETADQSINERVMRINFNSVMYLTYHALPHIIKTKGRLVAVSSISGYMGVPGHAVYSASKHAIHGFYDSLRLELKDRQVSCTILAPDFVQTEIHYRGLNAQGEPMKKRLGNDVAMSAEDCAEIMKQAVIKRSRIVATSPRAKAAFPLRGLIPDILDFFALRSRKKHALVEGK